MEKVVVGMSGGVDSSVAAWLLQEQGYEVIGVTMDLWAPAKTGEQSDIQKDAKEVAEGLGIAHYTLDCREAFEKYVICDFIGEYQAGRTPNPCIVCNRYLKWGALLAFANRLGAERIATGHYARIHRLNNGRYSLACSVTGEKDQTYALYRLTQSQLASTLMPVGAYSKADIRRLAGEIGLSVAEKPDSQDICFVPDQEYGAFLEKRLGKSKPGDILSVDGKVLGQHKGILHYTVGQRKGLGLALGKPVYVLEIRHKENQLVVGSYEDSLETVVYAKDICLMAEEDFQGERRLFAKIRYNHKGAWCKVTRTGEREMVCVFEEAQRAVTPGQAVVLYDGDIVWGGGVICQKKNT